MAPSPYLAPNDSCGEDWMAFRRGRKALLGTKIYAIHFYSVKTSSPSTKFFPYIIIQFNSFTFPGTLKSDLDTFWTARTIGWNSKLTTNLWVRLVKLHWHIRVNITRLKWDRMNVYNCSACRTCMWLIKCYQPESMWCYYQPSEGSCDGSTSKQALNG